MPAFFRPLNSHAFGVTASLNPPSPKMSPLFLEERLYFMANLLNLPLLSI